MKKFFFLYFFIFLSSILLAGKIDFTQSELQWLETHKIIRIAPDPDFLPIESFDEKGNYIGISADYMKLIEKELGIKFEVIRCKNWDEVLDKAQKREVDLLPAAAQTPHRAEHMLFSSSYLVFPGVIITRHDYEKIDSTEKLYGKKVTIVSGYVWQEYFTLHHPKIEIVLVNFIQDGLRDVATGEVDAMIATLPVALYYIEKEGILNLHVSGETEFFSKLSILTRKDWPILNSIINKALQNIPNKKKKEIYLKWISFEYNSFFGIRNFKEVLFIFLTQALYIIIIILLWRNFKKKYLLKYPEERKINILFITIVMIVFLNIIVILNEYLDIPNLILGAPKTPFNYRESLFESLLINLVGIFILRQFYKDIKIQKKMDISLRESEEKYKALYDNAPLAYQSLNENGCFIDVNPAWLNILGYQREEVIGKCYADFLHPDWKLHFEKNFPEFKRRGYVHDVQFKIRHKDGHFLIISFEGCIGYHPNGSFRQTYCVFQDITERKLMEQFVSTQAEVTKNMAEGAYIVGLHDVIIRWASPRFEGMFGYEPGEMIGKHASIVNAPIDLTPTERAEEIMEVIIRTGEWHGEVKNIKKDGTQFWCLASVSTFTHPEYGEVLLSVHTDITERKKAEEQINESLKEKKILLRELHHRVKNNLQIISSTLDMSRMRTNDQKAIDLFTDAKARIYAIALIHSQIYRNERFNEIDMEKHINELVNYLSSVYGTQKMITLIVNISQIYLSIAQTMPCVLILNELITNALKNAFKKGEKGTIVVSMQKSNQDNIIIIVKDDGKNVFEEIDFYKTETLGLKLVRNLVQQQLKGKIDIHHNNGIEFIIKFKLMKE
ncbi:MAG: transporter substrate-binding domain-containing protein [Armatimonadetes bacterium]|nr:transporter substrate-binding domain-containing protein [Armatimonadota bacterium]